MIIASRAEIVIASSSSTSLNSLGEKKREVPVVKKRAAVIDSIH